MRYIVFSDIHGNQVAFKQLLMDIDNVDDIDGLIFCGDMMGYYYHADEILSSIKDNKKIISVRGNHDNYYLNAIQNKKYMDECVSKYGNSYTLSLSEKNRSFLSQLPALISFDVDGKNIGVFHGSPFNTFEGRLYPDTCLSKDETDIIEKYDIIFLGHTHYRMMRKIGNALIINPGSLGQPRDGNGFSYCIFDFDRLICDFHNVVIDLGELFKEIELNEIAQDRITYLKSVLERKIGENL